jgi:hypothetical protein
MPTTAIATVLIPSPEWRLVTGYKRCRADRGACRQRGVYDLNRAPSGQRENWWAYCADHCYNHVWLDGSMYFPIPAEHPGWADQLP